MYDGQYSYKKNISALMITNYLDMNYKVDLLVPSVMDEDHVYRIFVSEIHGPPVVFVVLRVV